MEGIEYLTRIYHHFDKWEDWKSGMWRRVKKSEANEFLAKAIEFTGNAKEYGRWMMRVVNEWPFACEHNLTDLGQNRRAWIGHAACQMAINCPEYITRAAWGYLNMEQRDLANDQADRAIRFWQNERKDS